jgi:hypothetical protein
MHPRKLNPLATKFMEFPSSLKYRCTLGGVLPLRIVQLVNPPLIDNLT